LYAYKGWRLRSPLIEIDEDEDVSHISEAEFDDLCHQIQSHLNAWLNSSQFLPIDRQLRTHLVPTDEIRLVISATDRALLRLPWRLWQFFQDYSRSELALSLPDFTHSVKVNAPQKEKINILAILGNRQGINIDQDKLFLEQLPDTKLTLLVEPNIEQFSKQLWEQNWDMLFFAGHSSSRGQGQLQINGTDSLTIAQLRYGLQRAIAHGLKLAIFNSCDGLGLAWDLADLQIPQVIVMREPVPDRVAQAFLKHFLAAFSSGQPLYLAVRQAREQLQALEAEFPCATWLPIICQNPAEVPQVWQDWKSERVEDQHRTQSQIKPSVPAIGWRQLLFGSLLMTGVLLGLRSLGFLELLELWSFDRLMTLRPREAPDDRFLIVTIDEADIQMQDPARRRGSLSDTTLSQLLEKLQQARVIGLDIYRDFAVSAAVPKLVGQMRQPKLLMVCKSVSGEEDPTGIAPPPEAAVEQVGFSDFLADDDGVLRRHLLLLTPAPDSPCQAAYAFNMQLVFSYLSQLGIAASFTDAGNLQIQKVVFERLQNHTGGYHAIDARGNQILLNYRSLPSPEAIAPQVPLRQVLKGEVSPTQIKDRIVLIGVTAQGRDNWATPYGSERSTQATGVFLQAQMASQIISAVLDARPVLWVWSLGTEGLWIWGWTLGGAVLVRWGRSPLYQGLLAAGGLGLLTGASLLLLLQGGWVPLIPAGLGSMAASGIVIYRSIKR
ncbi:MAG: CHASE2 domain-containing protein, partial [Leptolyngbyaceae cyanobacterium CSU_1_4]|nr:CHASE2 domain-containing protein [Leptolyngbyaceae cyanobacterium CSU_1_4]